MNIPITHKGRPQQIQVHHHNFNYQSSVKVPGGYKARYKCSVEGCNVVRTGKEIYGRR